MNSEWLTTSLVDHYEVRSGLSKPATDFGSGYPFLTFKDVFYNYFTPEHLGDFVQATEKERAGCSILRGDVFLTRTSETMHELGMSCVALRDYKDATFNGFCKRLRPKPCNDLLPEYVGYYLRGPRFRQAVSALATMSTRASLNNEMIGRLEISFPPREIQVRISEILKSLDDRITLLRETNATLEAIAQALFKSWFVDFDPVRARAEGLQPEGIDATAAALFPDSFEGSVLGLVQKGWEVRSLDSIADYLNGLALQKFPPSEDAWLPVIKIAQLRKGDTEGADRAGRNIKPEYIIQNGDVLFSWSGSLEVAIWCGGEGALNQHLFKVTSAEFPKWFYYLWTRQHLPAFQQIAASKATTMGHIQRKHLTEAKVVVPPSEVVQMIGAQIEPLLDCWLANAEQAQTLTQLRDILLPRLISGQLRLPEA
ncbi:restriction endonuclease subunit S [Pseudomonas aeruginosa]|uniref:restriction endonuclease subunit S n=1 Tax=Pseudomonas aeruginosa TaxID=287 RepID=UPI001CA515CC|nr:restriction endonuclease subunit S [Pseudomonas aeruginosa]MBW6140945.1 restriction endonuclease subunit S [Pseudomonas aeruginosa]